LNFDLQKKNEKIMNVSFEVLLHSYLQLLLLLLAGGGKGQGLCASLIRFDHEKSINLSQKVVVHRNRDQLFYLLSSLLLLFLLLLYLLL